MGVVLAAFFALATTASFAQPEQCADADGQAAVYEKFTAVYAKKTLPEMETALAAGKEFLEKYGACEPLKEQIDFVKPQVARLEKDIPALKARLELAPFFARFDAGINNDNGDEIYAAGKEILARQPENLNIIFPMGVAGMKLSTPANNYKYADDGLRFSQLALSKIKGGAEFTKKDKKTGEATVGALQYEYTKPVAIEELTYSLAYLNYYGKKDKKTALPIYYELSQSSGRYKEDPRIFGTIGDYYVEQGGPIGEKIRIEIEGRKQEDTAEVLAQKEASIKALIALFNGYTERALDAYSRAHKVAKSDTPAAKAYKDNLYKIMQGLYKRRFEKETGLDAYVATTLAKPFPNPTSEVQPISDPDPVVTTTSTTGPGTGVGAANGTGIGAGNGSGMGAANGTGLGKPSGAGVSGAKTATPANGTKPGQTQSKPGTTATTKPKGTRN